MYGVPGQPCLHRETLSDKKKKRREIAACVWCPTPNIWVNLLSPNIVLVCITTLKLFPVCLISSNRSTFSLSIYLANKCENRLDLNPFSAYIHSWRNNNVPLPQLISILLAQGKFLLWRPAHHGFQNHGPVLVTV